MQQEPPEDWREREAKSDPELSVEEKEFLLNCPNDEDFCYIYSDVATFIKWLQSIEEADPEWVRIGQNGEIIAFSGTIPKGMLLMKGKSRKSQRHSDMVSYGPYYEKGEIPEHIKEGNVPDQFKMEED